MPRLTLISHDLCPYVQRAAIALAEKQVPYDRIDIDLSAKPDWFRQISPLGKTPVLKVDANPIFESAVILEYLEETTPGPLHPTDPLQRARHRGWIEVASAVLNAIAALYNAPDATAFAAARDRIDVLLRQVDAELGTGPWFAGSRFSLVDAAFGPVFRYFDTFERFGCRVIADDLRRIAEWRRRLAERPSVRGAVGPDYPEKLVAFVKRRDGHLARMLVKAPKAA